MLENPRIFEGSLTDIVDHVSDVNLIKGGMSRRVDQGMTPANGCPFASS